jgi:predicted lipoprotein with Yx(FWY)xxD motif
MRSRRPSPDTTTPAGAPRPQRGRAVGRRTTSARLRIAAGVIALGVAGVPVLSGAAGATSTAKGTEITTAQGAFGAMLVVGSGKYAGYTLYYFTGDQSNLYPCTAKIVKSLPGGPGSCTGPSNDKKAEWPAITTTGKPVAGAGVNQKLLGTVNRSGIGLQITYAGHPLYLFDQGPGQVTGQGWDEPSLPPWHGLWWLVAPSGAPLPWPGTLTTTTIGGKSVLASMMFTGIGWEPFPVYSYSGDTSTSSACTGSCAVAWPPLITEGSPGLTSALASSAVGTLARTDGTTQLTYHGKPLYLYASEGIAPSGGGFVATGSGSGVKAGSGTFSLVTP